MGGDIVGDDVKQEYFTASQLIRYLGLGRATFYKILPGLLESGKLNEYRLPGLSGVRYRKSEIDACFERVEPGNKKGGTDS
jgi:predicted DNA-binding transcriptional regulator AlpA